MTRNGYGQITARMGKTLEHGAGLSGTVLGPAYANHNTTPHVRRLRADSLRTLDGGKRGINVGSGNRRLYPDMINVDIRLGAGVDAVPSSEALPFASGTIDGVVTQETLERVQDPSAAVRERARVLAPGAILYLQVAFGIGYHPGPHHYWRFMREVIVELVEREGLACHKASVSVGAAVGFYRIAVEFGAILAARISPRFYVPARGAMALVLYPLKWLDPCLHEQHDHIAGGYIVVVRKSTVPEPEDDAAATMRRMNATAPLDATP